MPRIWLRHCASVSIERHVCCATSLAVRSLGDRPDASFSEIVIRSAAKFLRSRLSGIPGFSPFEHLARRPMCLHPNIENPFKLLDWGMARPKPMHLVWKPIDELLIERRVTAQPSKCARPARGQKGRLSGFCVLQTRAGKERHRRRSSRDALVPQLRVVARHDGKVADWLLCRLGLCR